MNELKSITVLMWSLVVWIINLNYFDVITFILASILTILSIVYVAFGIHGRALNNQLTKRKIQEMDHEEKV